MIGDANMPMLLIVCPAHGKSLVCFFLGLTHTIAIVFVREGGMFCVFWSMMHLGVFACAQLLCPAQR